MKDFLKKLVKCLKAFPMGVLMLLLSYILVYLINGEEIYIMLINKLTSISTLVYEIILAGLTYSALYFFLLYVIPYLQEFEERNPKVLQWKDLLRYLIFCAGIIVFFEVATYIVKLTGLKYSFDEEIEIIFFGIVCLGLIIVAIGYIMQKSIEDKKLNDALKNKRKEK